jgi:ribosome biogenesis GTPase
MANRKLSRRQAWRIRKIQEERIRRAQKKAAHAAEAISTDGLSQARHGLVVANYGAELEVEDAGGIRYRCVSRQNLGPLVVGDQVVWQPGAEHSGVITAGLPRKSVLVRPDPAGVPRPVAANIDRIIVVAAARPLFSAALIDQYLVAAEHTAISPLLLFNKVDLLDEAELRAVHAQLAVYAAIGYPVLYASTAQAHGMDALIEALHGHTSAFVGQSGVGKSSLIKALLPDEEIRIGELSESVHGRHTTSAARLYHLPTGGQVIDSPGVREFRLGHLEPGEIARGFVELRPFLGKCRFRDCRHRQEPGCRLREAVEDGEVSAARFESYLQLAEAAEAWTRGRG